MRSLSFAFKALPVDRKSIINASPFAYSAVANTRAVMKSAAPPARALPTLFAIGKLQIQTLNQFRIASRRIAKTKIKTSTNFEIINLKLLEPTYLSQSHRSKFLLSSINTFTAIRHTCGRFPRSSRRSIPALMRM